MFECIVCGKPGDRHHVIHKSEGGIETPLNYVYLCEEHHRGKFGPHANQEVDRYYKLRLQRLLEDTFSEKFYTAMEIRKICQLSNSSMKKFMSQTRLHKEGYDRNDIIYFIMGGSCYRNEPGDLQIPVEISR